MDQNSMRADIGMHSIRTNSNNSITISNNGRKMIFCTIFSTKFVPSTINFVYAEFCCNGKWGTGSNRTQEFPDIDRH